MTELVERPLRSVFVGNIPYEVTEEKLKEIFSEVGPVLSLKLVYDRDTGKPKGYGFCEYKDVETAMSAMRNLNGFEINGRILRVDSAGSMSGGAGGGGRDRDSHNLPSKHEVEAPVFTSTREDGPPPPEKTPEVISRAVASLPPEQMFELMKQMKLCIQNNPAEARTMLLQNPQLAYALLQALVVMKIVEPATALTMLHKENPGPMGNLLPEGQMNMMQQSGFGGPPPATDNPWIAAAAGVPLMPQNPAGPFGAPQTQGPPPTSVSGGDMDLRQLDPRMRNQPQDFDLRDPRAQSAQDRFSGDPRRAEREMRDRDMRGDRDLRDPRAMSDSRDRDLRDRDLRDPRVFGTSAGSTGPTASNSSVSNASMMPSDPRAEARRARLQASDSASAAGSLNTSSLPAAMAGLGPGATDAERQALIMQVLQLSDEQIAEFPPEQRQSILVLKEQIAKSINQNR